MHRYLFLYTNLFLYVPLLLLGCFGNQTRSEPDPFLVQFSTDTLLTYDLAGELHVHSDSLGNPTDLAVGDKFIFVGDPISDRPITAFDRDSGEFVAYVVNKGKGPLEIPSLWSMDFKPGTDSGWIYSYPRIMKFLDALSITDKMVRLSDGGAPMSPVWIEDEKKIASTGGYESGRVGLYMSTGEFAGTMGPDPPGEPDIPMVVRQHAYEAILKTNSDGTRIVVASKNTDRIEIFDASEMLHLVRGPRLHEPVFSFSIDSNGDPRMMVENETIQSYISVAVTDHMIYALYSGRSRGWVRSQGYFSPPAKTVIAFTWSGHPIGVLEIEDGAMSIGVSSDGQFLYAIYRRPIPMVMRYELPSLRE